MRPILPCPACSTFLLLPEAADPAELTCPECQHTIALSDLASWEVGTGSLGLAPVEPTQQTAGSTYGTLATDSGDPSTSADDLSIEANESASDELQLAASESPARAAKPSFSVQPITHEQFERMKRKKRSPFWSVAQIVLGGLASVPIALLILWHGLGRDVADAGPTVARYVPWIVPERFHPLDMAEDDDEADVASDQGASERKRGESGFRQFDELLPPEGEPPESDDEPPKVALGEIGSPSASNDGAEKSGSSNPPGKNGSISSLSRPREDSAKTSLPSAMKGSLQNSAAGTSPNVILQIKSCEKHIDAWRIAVRDGEGDLRELAQEIYGDLVGVAAATQALTDGSPYFRVVRDAMQPVSQAIKRQDDIQNLIIQGAEHWSRNTYRLDDDDDAGKALAVICKIDTVTESETEWIIQPLRENLPKSVTEVRIPRSIAPSLQAGQELLLLGTLTESPANVVTLAEIQGEEPPQELEGAPNEGTFQACYLYAF